VRIRHFVVIVVVPFGLAAQSPQPAIDLLLPPGARRLSTERAGWHSSV
jgi:hypothetical protein